MPNVDFAQLLQGNKPVKDLQPALNFSEILQKNLGKQPLTVSGANGTPTPPSGSPAVAKPSSGISKFMEDLGLWKAPNYSQDYLKDHPSLQAAPQLEFKIGQGVADPAKAFETAGGSPIPLTPAQQAAEKIKFVSQSSTEELLKRRYGTNSATNTAGFLFAPLDPLTRDISDIWQTNSIRDQVISGKIDQSVFDGIESLHKNNFQITGDVAQAVLVPYNLELGGAALADSPAQVALKTSLADLAKTGMKQGGFAGFQFGVASALSSGSTNPDDISKIIVTNTAGGTLLGGALHTVLPALAKVVANTNAAKQDLVQNLMAAGYSKEEAFKLASQGGYVGKITDSSHIPNKVDPEWVKSDDATPGIVEQLQNAEAGSRIFTERKGQGGTMDISGVKSTFPDWIPEDLRRSDIVNAVAEHLKNGTVPLPSASRQVALYNHIADMVDAEGLAKQQAMEMAMADGQINEKSIAGSIDNINQQITEAQAEYQAGPEGKTNEQKNLPPGDGQAPPAQAAKAVFGGEGSIQQRGLITSIKESPLTASKVAQEIEGTYKVKSNPETIQKAASAIIRDPSQAIGLALSDDGSLDAQATRLLLYREANARAIKSIETSQPDMEAVADAKRYGEQAARKGTEAGQAVQILSTLDKDLAKPDTALFKAIQYVEGKNRTKIPELDKSVGKFDQKITDIHSEAMDQIIEETPELKKPIKTKGAPAVPKPVKTVYDTGNEFVDQLLNYKGDPEQQLAKKVGDDITPPKAKKPNLIKDMVDTLFKVAKEDLPKKAKLAPRSPTEFIREALTNKEEYQGVFDNAQGILLAKYKNDPEAMAKLEQFFQRDLKGDLPIAEKQVTGALKEQIKDQQVSLGDLVRQHYTEVDKTGKALADKIIEQTGASGADAKALADKVQARFAELTTAKKQQIMKQMFKQMKQAAPKNFIQKVIEKSNLGAFDSQEFRGQVADSLGLKSLSDSDAKIILDRANKIQGLEDGRQKTYEINGLRKFISDLAPQGGLRKWLVHPFKMSIFSAAAPYKLMGDLSMQAMEGAAKIISTPVDAAISMFSGERSISPSGILEGFKQARESIGSSADYFKTGLSSGLRAQFENKLSGAGINDFKGEIKYFNNPIAQMFTNLPGRTMGAITEQFGDMAFASSIYESAEVQAMNEGLKGEAFTSRVKELFKTPDDQAVLGAIKFSDFMTFRDDNMFSKIFGAIRKGFREGGGEAGSAAGQILMPVAQVPGSILQKMVFDFGPGSPLKLLWDMFDPRNVGNKQKLFVQDFGRMSVGGLLMGTGYYLASKNIMTGSYPTTKSESDRWQAENIQQNSVRYGNQIIPLGHSLGPAGLLMGLGADLYKLHQDNSGLALLSAAGSATVKKVGEMPMLYGLLSSLQAVSNPDQYGSSFLQREAGAFVPAAVRRAAQTIDPVKRNPSGVVEQLESEIPGLTKRVPAAMDVLGNPKTNLTTLDPTGRSLFRPSPLLDEAARLGVNVTSPNKTIDGVKLNNKEYEIYSTKKGHVLNMLLNQAMHDPNYQALSDDNKKTVFQDYERAATEVVNNITFPIIMIQKYQLPLDPKSPSVLDGVKRVVSTLNKEDGFKKLTPKQQAWAIKKTLGLPTN